MWRNCPAVPQKTASREPLHNDNESDVLSSRLQIMSNQAVTT